MRGNRLYILILCLAAQICFAQEGGTNKTRIHIDNADEITYSRNLGNAQRCLGHVAMRHDSALFFCDSAYYYENMNSVDAFGNIHIIVNDTVEIFSNTMNYDGERRFAELHDDVRLIDDSTMLETQYMTYDRNLHLASYPDHAVTTRGDKKLVSDVGYYRDDIKELSFFDNVVVTSPKYQMYSDTLYYNTRIEKMWFTGPTTIINEENTMQGESGYYLVDDDVALFDKKPVLFNETQRFTADTIYYDRQRSFAKAMHSAVMIDTAYKVVMNGNYVELWKKKGFSYVTDSARMIYYDGGDSLYMRADSMFFKFKSELNKEEKVWAYRGVRFFKSDLQGKCDSIAFLMADSTIRMRIRPVLWAENSQLTADSIDVVIADHKIDSVIQKENAFIISRDTIEGYNQIKGVDIISHFRKGSLHKLYVTQDAETIYWLREDDQSLIGINVSKSSSLQMLMQSGNMSRIKYFKNIDETMFPESELKESDRYLFGFNWNDEARPKDKNDIFRITDGKGMSFGSGSATSGDVAKPHHRKKD